MFARRKHRPQEDEPLVPHGLVWQATDEPSSDKVDSAPEKPPAPARARPTEMQVRPSPSPEAEPTVHGEPSKLSEADSPLNKLGAISPPIAWPSPKTASVIRRPIEEFNSVPLEATEANRRTATEAQTVANVKPLGKSSPSDLVSNASLPQAPFPVRTEAAPERKVEVIELGADEAQPPRSELFKAGALTLQRFVVTCSTAIGHAISKGLQTITSGVRAPNKALQAWWVSTSTRMSGGLATAREFSGQKLIAARTNAMAVAQRARGRRVRVRIVKPAYLQVLIARSRAAWDARRENIRREPRLWGSMAMAALSALLAVAVISGISRYAPGADASRRDSVTAPQQNPVVHATPASRKIQRASTAGHKSTVAAEERSAKPSPLHTKAAVKPKDMIASKTAPKTTARRIHRVSDEDDYVAPDTYHYYGKGNGSR